MSARVFAVVLSLIAPGAGHLMLGERVRGVIAAALATLVLIALPLAIGPLLWASLALRVVAAVDVAVGVRTIRPMSVAGAAVAGAGPVLGLVVLWAVGLSVHRTRASSMEPTLHIGQRLVVNRLAYAFDPPARGDLIAFRMPCTPSQTSLKRVVGVAGDTVEIRCNQLHVNGAAAPAELVAEGPACRYDDFDDVDGGWRVESCSRYRETLGGVVYQTLHGDDRPERDRDRAAAAGPLVETEWDDSHDFPELPGRLSRLSAPTLPSCGLGDPRHDLDALGSLVHTLPPGPEPTDACGPQLHYVVPAGAVFVLGDNRQNSSDSRIWGPVPVDAIEGEVALVFGSAGP